MQCIHPSIFISLWFCIFAVKTSLVCSNQISLKGLPLVPLWHIVFSKLICSTNTSFYANIVTTLCNKLENKTDCVGLKICTMKIPLTQLSNRSWRPETRGCSCTCRNCAPTYIKWEFMTIFINFNFHCHLRSISLTGSEGCVWVYKISDLESSKHQFPVLMLAGVRVAY
jgi:hypothetical protein